MREGWQIKKLGDVADVYDGPHATPTTVDSGPIFLGIGALQDGEINLGETRHVTHQDFIQWTRRVRPQANDVVFSYETRLGQAAIIPDGLVCCLGRRMGLIRFNNGTVFPRYFLYQYLSPQFREFLESKTIRGATVDRLSIKDIPSFPILLPPLSEQERIVALLDEAFAGLATAKANAERNLQNARALFESHLQSVFSQRGEGWLIKSLVDLCIVDWGNTDLTKRAYVEDGKFLAVSAAGCDGRIGHREHERNTPVLSAIGAQCGRMFLPEEDFTAIKNTITLTSRQGQCTGGFLYRLLTHVDLPKRGAAQPFISKGDIQEFQVVVPESLSVQQEIEESLACLEAETHRLTHLYERKLAALEELKKSLLHQAFNGEL
ncbi:restriction endonuclease subunit S [Cyanobium sp. Cruz CV13-4-11]|uniref:restriction endonuclease subunit S n=1 Tax=unclassified Cyanobium TaxID=2627006 RepID=UPI0020CFC1F4|nr:MULTISPECIES: restriction endonuclease subunit S [unclassified Cyanobium]MCP9901773.1 restriction endonuclease subunit S [Cyanobium sp. Cruz CV11-17]MCP9919928.1 restriction endonuclease subunit S [Cyanobium sp. Cruz CV13-4-11]